IFIEFMHDENVSVNFLGEGPHLLSRSVQAETSTSFTWPIDANIPKASFVVREDERDVRVSLDTDRIWWAITNRSQSQAPDWQVSAIDLERDAFAPMSDAALIFRFPRSAKLRAFVAFERGDRRALTPLSGNQYIIHLNAFSDAIYMENFGTQK